MLLFFLIFFISSPSKFLLSVLSSILKLTICLSLVSASVKDDPRCKTTLGGRQPSGEDNLRLKMTFGRRQPSGKPSMEDNFWLETNLGGRRPSMKDDLLWWLLPLTVKAQLSPNQNCYLLFKPEIEFGIVDKLCGIVHVHVCRDEDIFRQRWLNKYNWVGGHIFLCRERHWS